MKKSNKLHNLKVKALFVVICVAILFIVSNTNLYGQYDRKVVFEEFTETWCGPCASVAPSITAWLDESPDYIAIYYVSYFNVDGERQYYGKEEYNKRKTFYKVPFYPYAQINAENCPDEYNPGVPANISRFSEIIDTMARTTPVKIDINFQNDGATGYVNVKLTSDITLNNKKMYLFIVEKHHKYEIQLNGTTDYHDLMRQMLPSGDGETFSINAGETLTFDYEYSLPEDINFDLYATVLVQDSISKYIYQAESVFKPAPIIVIDRETLLQKVIIIPNPVVDDINLFVNIEDAVIQKVDIFNTVGQKVNSVNSQNSNRINIESTDFSGQTLPHGIYYLKITTNKSVFTKKCILIR